MSRGVSIVGAGINGILAAYSISEDCPDCKIDIYEAEAHPSSPFSHKGVTYGSRDARHITGSESIGFESSVHRNALRNTPSHTTAGWLLKDEASLTVKEKHWREKFETSYVGSDRPTQSDFAHAELNYRGLRAWNDLIIKYPFMSNHVLTSNGVDVYFVDKESFESDLDTETKYCQRYFNNNKIQPKENDNLKKLYSKKLLVPGLSIKITSLANDILYVLESNKNVKFHWQSTIENSESLDSDIVVWTAGVTHAQPLEYEEHLVQGIVGCWVTMPNRGYRMPFKIAAPTPSAYMNFTPDNDQLHISGGFGWTGEFTDLSVIKKIAIPTAKHFVKQINSYLDTDIKVSNVDFCVRPSTPTGLPLQLTKTVGNKLHIYISGSGKSGTTHAPILSEYVVSQIKNYYV